MNRGLQAAGLNASSSSCHRLSLTTLTVIHLVSFKSVPKSTAFSDVFFKLFFSPDTGEPTSLKIFPNDLLCYFNMDVKVIAFVSSSFGVQGVY